MKLKSVNLLKGNEILARPVMTKNYSELLAVGTVLKQEYIEKLKELNMLISECYLQKLITVTYRQQKIRIFIL